MNLGLGTLSERELEVLKLVATGATNQQIARALFISPNTVKVHLRNIFEKLGVQSRTEATMEAVRRGWVAVGAASLAGETPAAPPAPAAFTVSWRRPPLAGWQRVYLVAALVAVILASFAPGWWQARASRVAGGPFSDAGRPQLAQAPRPDAARWTAGAALPEPRSRLALTALDGRLYAIGGETARGVSGLLTVYDPAVNAWSVGPSKPVPAANIAAAVLGAAIHVPGGTTAGGDVSAAHEVYDSASGTWVQAAVLPAPRAAHALAALDGRLYLFGGWDGSFYRAETYIYDPAAGRWDEGAALPGPRAFAAAVAVEDGIFVVGGYDGRQALSAVLRYAPAQEGSPDGPWTSRAPLAQPRAGLGLTAVGPRLYAVGGAWGTPLAFNEQYDAAIDAWSRIGTPVIGEWRHLGLAAAEQKLYAVGGWNDSYLAVNEQYQALIRQLLPFGTQGG